MSDDLITRAEFESRVVALFLGGVGPGLPRKKRDRSILLKSAALDLEQGRDYTEASLNAALEAWLEKAHGYVRMDHVSLRRYLVDEGLLRRDRPGKTYRVQAATEQRAAFGPGVDELDVLAAVRAAAADKERRRRIAERERSTRSGKRQQ
jgi:hypothetical protein